MSRMIPKNITSHLVYSDIITEETLASRASADTFASNFVDSLTRDETDGALYSYTVESDDETGANTIN